MIVSQKELLDALRAVISVNRPLEGMDDDSTKRVENIMRSASVVTERVLASRRTQIALERARKREKEHAAALVDEDS